MKRYFVGVTRAWGEGGGGANALPVFFLLKKSFDAELKKGQLTQQKYFLNDYLGVAKTRKRNKNVCSDEATRVSTLSHS